MTKLFLMAQYYFEVNIDPRPKKRPKVYRWATVNPSEEDEKELADKIRTLENCPKTPLTGQIKVQLKFYKNPPKNTPKWKLPHMDDGVIRPNTSPDLDNYVKLILDALNGVVWDDDRYIVEMHSAKYFTTGEPKVQILVDHLDIPNLKKEFESFYKDGSKDSDLEIFFT